MIDQTFVLNELIKGESSFFGQYKYCSAWNPMYHRRFFWVFVAKIKISINLPPNTNTHTLDSSLTYLGLVVSLTEVEIFNGKGRNISPFCEAKCIFSINTKKNLAMAPRQTKTKAKLQKQESSNK